jgi:tail lysozyme
VATETIREFLVALGYKQDEAALKKFEDGINKATKAVFTLAAAVEGTAVAVAAGIAKFASNLEALYYASVRTGSSVTNLKALDRWAENFGAAAGEAMASVEGLAHALRTNPGNESLLVGMGVQLKHLKDGTVDAQDALVQLAAVFKRQPLYVSEQYAGMLGINENTLLALRRGDMKELLRIQKEMAHGNWGKAAADSHAFMVNLRDLFTLIEAFGTKIGDALEKKLGWNLEKIGKWLDKNGDHLANQIVDAINMVLTAAEWLGQKILALVAKLKDLDTATDGWSTKLIAIAAILQVTGAGSIIGGVLSLTAALFGLKTAIAGVGAASSSVGLLGLLGRLSLWAGAAYGAYQLYNHTSVPESERGTGKATPWAQKIEDWVHQMIPGGKANYAGTLLQAFGLTRDQAAGVIANLQAESGLDEHAVGDHGNAYGLAQWHRAGQEAFKKWSGIDIRQSTFAQQMGFLEHDIGSKSLILNALHNSRSPFEAGSVFSRLYERPAAGDAEASRRGEAAVRIAQSNTFNIHGADSKDLAETVSKAQQRTNAELTRNLGDTAR